MTSTVLARILIWLPACIRLLLWSSPVSRVVHHFTSFYDPRYISLVEPSRFWDQLHTKLCSVSWVVFVLVFVAALSRSPPPKRGPPPEIKSAGQIFFFGGRNGAQVASQSNGRCGLPDSKAHRCVDNGCRSVVRLFYARISGKWVLISGDFAVR